MTPKAIAAELREHATCNNFGCLLSIEDDHAFYAAMDIAKEDKPYTVASQSGGLLEGFAWYTLARMYLCFIAEMIESNSGGGNG